MDTISTNIAESLLKIKAVLLKPNDPFTWASGWKSPVYCDNRLTLSYPDLRKHITKRLADLVKNHFPATTGVAGVATAGVPQGALVADALDQPFIYVRSKAKGHGRNNLIEGQIEAGGHYVVVEDLISTGGSSIKAVEAVKEAGGHVTGVISIFTYGFPQAMEAFSSINTPHQSLVDLNELLEKAVEIDYISSAEMVVIDTWRKAPAQWAPQATIE